MKNFCAKCGTPIDAATGLCPNCDREQIDAIAAKNTPEPQQPTMQKRYCEKCGSDLDATTGLCTNPDCGSKTTMGSEDIFSADKPKNTDKTKKKKSTAATTIITILLASVLFFTSLLAVLIYDVRNIADKDNIEGLLNNIEASDLFETVKKTGNGKEIEDFYHDMEVKRGVEMDDDKVNDFINRSSAKEVIAKKVSNFGEDFFEDGGELTIEREEVLEFLYDNERDFEKEFDVELTSSIANEIADHFVSQKEFVLIDTRDFEDEIPALYYGINIGFSYVTMVVLILLSGLIIFLMFKNGILQAFYGVGITYITLGGFTSLVALLAAALSSLWKMMSGGSYIGVAIGNFMAINALPSIIMLVLGIGLLVARVFVKKHLAKKQNDTNFDEEQSM